MIGIALVCIGTQVASSSVAAAAHDLAWRTAGIERTERAPGGAATQHMRVRGFLDETWIASDPSLRFARIPGTEPLFDTAEPAASYVAWRDQLAPLTWAGDEPVLRLVQVEGSGRAQGRLRLVPPATTGDPARATRVTHIDRFRVGCAMEYGFELPVELTASGVELSFAWDLHSPLELERLRLTPSCADVALPTIALELETPDPALRVEPARLPLSDESGARASVRVIPRRGSRAELQHLAYPECVAVSRIEPRDGGWSIEFEAQPLASAFHECHGVRIDVSVGDDPQPFSRYVRIEHGSRVVDPDDVLVVAGVFLSGERVELWSDGRRSTWCLPDRLPCAPALLDAFGFQRVAGFEASSDAGAVDERLRAAALTYRVVGATTDVALVHADAWSAACKR